MVETAQGDVVIASADSHVSDFPGQWSAGLVERYGARLPHVSRNAGTSSHGLSPRGLDGDWIVAEGIPAMPTGAGNVGGFPRDERVRRLANFDHTKDAPAGAIEPHARVAAMEQDGLKAEVLFATYALRLNTLRDADLQRECAAASNSWLAEFCSAAPTRLIGAACISNHDPAAAVVELHRSLKLGLKGAAVPAIPPPELSYASSHYERFWAAAAEAGVPVALHALPAPETAAASQRRRPTIVENGTMNLIEEHHLANILYDHPIQICLTQLILSGVLERHPKLRIVISEWGNGWLPNFLSKIDDSYSGRPEGLSLKMLPSEYFMRQIWCSFDRGLELPLDQIERLQDKLMFASDYPHIESSWPESRGAFVGSCGKASAAVQRKLGWENLAKLYGLPTSTFVSDK